METSTTTLTRTVSCKLETSQRKTELVQDGIDEFAEMMSFTATILPSFGENNWHPHNNTIYQHVTEKFDDMTVKSTIAREAGQKVAEAFQSWRERGKEGEYPQPVQFRDANYMRLSHQDRELEENERGWGLKTSFIPYNSIWFHIDDGPYQREFLERVTEGDASLGSAELILTDDGTLYCNLTVKWDVEIAEPGDVNRAVGVDLGENTLYALCVVERGENLDTNDGPQAESIASVKHVELESGREFRHHRTQMQRRRTQLMEEDDLRGLRKLSQEQIKYTEQVTNRASREIVETVVEYTPAVLRLEDLSGYRESAEDEDIIHDWPYAMLQEQICYKAKEEGIPVQFVDSAHTSTTCRKCQFTATANRDGDSFECHSCGYEVHADVNAGMNIAVGKVVDRR
jgi:IS605 OrfB family transposase